MTECKGMFRCLKWAGIAAVVALPLSVLFRKRKVEDADPPPLQDDDDSNIFAAELEE